MSGDLSSSNRIMSWLASTITTQGEEIILPGNIAQILTMPDHADWTFAGDFTIELFGVKFANVTAAHGMISHYNGGGGTNQRSWSFGFDGSVTPKKLRTILSTDGVNPTSDVQVDWSPAPVANTAYNLCTERSGSTLRMYVDGAMMGAATAVTGAALFNSTETMQIGLGFQKTANPWAGRFKAVRITKAARYASDSGYTVPTLPLPTS